MIFKMYQKVAIFNIMVNGVRREYLQGTYRGIKNFGPEKGKHMIYFNECILYLDETQFQDWDLFWIEKKASK